MHPEEVTVNTNLSVSLENFFKDHSYSQIAILVDENTNQNCLPLIQPALPPFQCIEIPSGEKHKVLETCIYIWDSLTNWDFDRHSLLINLGGGVIGDMGGFCASTYKRGIDFIHIPTTLLSQVDASVGGKLGIDFKGFKNHIGVFNLPNHVFISTVFLKTLSKRELRSGFAEVIKHSLIADEKYWKIIRSNDLLSQNWEEIVDHSVNIKGAVVKSDPKEKGMRKILNFGHSVGHAIETYFLNSEVKGDLLHGEAVAAGMICETYLSEKHTGLTSEDAKSIISYIERIFGKIKIEKEDIPEILNLIKQDKKNEKGVINFSLLKAIGNCSYNLPVTADDIEAALNRYCRI